MDQQHRQDLERNDLAEAITGFGSFWSRWGNAVLIVVLILAIGFTAYRFLNVRAREAHENAWADLAAESSPSGFAEIARTHADPTVKALAYLRAGDLLLNQAVLPQDEPAATPPATQPAEGATPPAQPETPAKVDPVEALEDALGMYGEALKAAPNDVIKSNALLGLAAVAESQRKFDEAKWHYDEVVKLARENYPQLAARAQARLDMLPSLQTPVEFAPEPAPAAPAEAAAPATTPGSILDPAMLNDQQLLSLPPIDFTAPAQPPTLESPPAAPAPTE